MLFYEKQELKILKSEFYGLKTNNGDTGRETSSLPLGLSALDGMWGVASPLMTLLVKLRL